MSQTSEDLRAAYDYLEDHGWCQGTYATGDEGGSGPTENSQVCLDGALLWGPHLDDGCLFYLPTVANKARHVNLIEAIAAQINPQWQGPTTQASIWFWNDLPSTTFEDVKLVLKKAIYEEESKDS